MDPAVELKRRVIRYLKDSGLSPTAFGLRVAKNTSLVQRINDGEIGLKTIRKVTKFLDQQEAA